MCITPIAQLSVGTYNPVYCYVDLWQQLTCNKKEIITVLSRYKLDLPSTLEAPRFLHHFSYLCRARR